MNLYLVEDRAIDYNDYDVYVSAVVAASSEEEARETRHGHPVFNPNVKIHWVSDKEQLAVRLIGTCIDEQTGVIDADFNAG
jgi:hypothetical protein